jgi:hypothetical protein
VPTRFSLEFSAAYLAVFEFAISGVVFVAGRAISDPLKEAFDAESS